MFRHTNTLVKKMAAFGRLLVMMAMVMLTTVNSADPDFLQDLCVADFNSAVKVNGYVCKSNATVQDFFFAGIANPGDTNNPMGSIVRTANVQQIPGLNTLGVSLARIDYAPGGLNPPHSHPRANEIIFVLEGELYAGFITTAGVLFSKSVKKGENFVFPRGLIHFQMNIGKGAATAIAAFNSQFQGIQMIAPALFGASPPVPDDVLSKAFRIDTKEVDEIKSKFAPKS